MKNQKRMRGTKLEILIKDIISQHEKFRDSYMWSSPDSASSRRLYEKQNSREPISFMFQGKVYGIEQTVNCTWKNVYYSISVIVDGVSKNINSLKKLVA